MLLTRQSVLPRLAPTAHWLPDKARGIFQPFCHCTSWRTNGVVPSPPLSPCVRLLPHTATAWEGFSSCLSDDSGQDSPPSHPPGSYFEAPLKLWSFAMYAAFPRSDD